MTEVKRRRKTEGLVRALYDGGIVSWIHELQDDADALRAEKEKLLSDYGSLVNELYNTAEELKELRAEVERLEEKLNADLIAAAPDMYEDLIIAIGHIKEICLVRNVPLPQSSLDRFERTLAKARGEVNDEKI